jgi:RNA polymerase sigma-32 factor
MILRFLVDNVRLVRVGRSRGERRIFFGLSGAERSLAARGVEATPTVLSALLDADSAEVESMTWRLAHSDLPIDESTDEFDDALTTNGVESCVAHRELCAAVRDVAKDFVASLDTRHAEILRARFLEREPSTLQELGDRFGVSRERIRQIEESLLQRLRAQVRERLPDPVLWANAPPETPR